METWRIRFQIKWSWNKKGNSCSTNDFHKKVFLWKRTAEQGLPFFEDHFVWNPFPSCFHGNESQSKDCLFFKTTLSNTVSIVFPRKWIAEQGLPLFHDFIWNRSFHVPWKWIAKIAFLSGPLYLKLFPSYFHGNELQTKDCLSFKTALSETIPFVFLGK